LRLDLWSKVVRVLWTAGFNNNFSLFQLQTENNFYKQRLPYIGFHSDFFFEKKYPYKNLQF
jgi:hypothetical protein